MSSSSLKSVTSSTLKPAAELARASGIRFPNESAEYRRAREALLAEEIELRRHIERVAEQRRALPPGGEVKKNYAFEGEQGPASFADLFGDKDTLVVYSYMFGPQRERPCPMCTSLLSAWDGEVPDIQQRVALAIVARSPIARLVAVQARTRLASSAAVFRYLGRVQPRLSCADQRRRRRRGVQRVHAASGERCHNPAFLGRRDERRIVRSRTGSARRARSDAALDHPRRHAGRTRHRLVSEAELWRADPAARAADGRFDRQRELRGSICDAAIHSLFAALCFTSLSSGAFARPVGSQ